MALRYLGKLQKYLILWPLNVIPLDIHYGSLMKGVRWELLPILSYLMFQFKVRDRGLEFLFEVLD